MLQMWCCCCPFAERFAGERSSLLQHQPSNTYNGQVQRLSQFVDNTDTAMSRSLDGGRTTDGRGSSSESIRHIEMKQSKVQNVDKRLQDHATLYNALIDQSRRLDELMTELRRMFPDQNPQCTLEGTFQHLNRLTASCESVHVVRPHPDAPCPQVSYDGRDVPYQAIPAFISYNAAGRHVRELLDKMPAAASSIRLVLADERRLERDVLVASLGRDGPVCAQNCRDDIAALRDTALPGIEDLLRRTRTIARELELFQTLRNGATTTATADA